MPEHSQSVSAAFGNVTFSSVIPRQRRIVFGAAITQSFAVNAFVEPDILIVDEALSVGDNLFQMKCMKKMRELMDGGTAVLFVSHDMNAVRRFCDRAIWLDHGVLRQEGEANKVLDSYADFLKCGDQYPAAKDGAAEAAAKKEREVQPGVLAEILSVRFVDELGR